MNAPSVFVATAGFWILLLLSIFLPPRNGVIAFILLTQFDLTAVAYYSDASLGWENGIKTVLVPTILLLRIWPIDLLPTAFGRIREFWLFFVVYAGISVYWSAYRLSAIKMMGYFYAYTILFLIFTVAWRRNWFDERRIIFVVWTSISLAVIQTYCLGNTYGNPEYEFRFTSFTGSQSFAPFLICMFVLLLLLVRRTSWGLATAAATIVALVLTGSRSTFLGSGWVLLIVLVALGTRFRRSFSPYLIVRNILLAGMAVLCLGLLILVSVPGNRLDELLTVATSRDNTFEDIGTFAWRLSIYQTTLEGLSGRSWSELLIGSGTSSGADVALQTGFFQEENVNPNRCIHDEFLRCLWEWGLLGLSSFVLFLVATFRLCFKLIRETGCPQAWAWLAILGPLLIGLLVENVLADGSSPGGVAYCLVLASMAGALGPALSKVRAVQTTIGPARSAG